jgi:hypothetical protein
MSRIGFPEKKRPPRKKQQQKKRPTLARAWTTSRESEGPYSNSPRAPLPEGATLPELLHIPLRSATASRLLPARRNRARRSPPRRPVGRKVSFPSLSPTSSSPIRVPPPFRSVWGTRHGRRSRDSGATIAPLASRVAGNSFLIGSRVWRILAEAPRVGSAYRNA